MQKVKEYHQIFRVKDCSQSFCTQLLSIIDNIKSVSEGKTIQFVRFFLSDISNQKVQVVDSVKSLGDIPISIIGQPPLDGSKVAAWVYLTEGELNACYNHRWDCMMTSDKEGSLRQMEDIFQTYEASLHKCNLTVKDNCIRTWIFCRDIDNNYEGVVVGRRNHFDSIGLTPKTHYIASTGIQGNCENHKDIVMMDAYSVSGLKQEQISYIKGSTHLNPTHEYGVTFERGTSVSYGDRKHIFISGTASIDNKGSILHTGDIIKQTHRMLENITVLLNEADATLSDIKSSILYLRDIADYQEVKSLIDTDYPFLDPVFVLAPVCRPGWLIEMECIATTEQGNPEFEKF